MSARFVCATHSKMILNLEPPKKTTYSLLLTRCVRFLMFLLTLSRSQQLGCAHTHISFVYKWSLIGLFVAFLPHFHYVAFLRGASARTKTAYTHVRVSCGLAVCHILFGKQFSLYFALLLVFIYDCHYLNICLASPRNFDKLLSPGEKIFFCFDFTVKKSVHLNIALKTMKTQYYTFLSFRTFFFYCSTTHQPPQPIHLKKLLYNTSCILAAT